MEKHYLVTTEFLNIIQISFNFKWLSRPMKGGECEIHVPKCEYLERSFLELWRHASSLAGGYQCFGGTATSISGAGMKRAGIWKD
jgi:hypothetical protein